MDVLGAFLLDLNLRDSTVEDNVRKRPFTTKNRPAHPFGLPESGTKIQKRCEPAKKKAEIFGSYGKTPYICSVKAYVLTIQVSFLRGQAVYVTTHFKPHTKCGFLFYECFPYLRKLFIIIFRKPLLVAIFRLMEISLLPENIKTSTALGDNSK